MPVLLGVVLVILQPLGRLDTPIDSFGRAEYGPSILSGG